MLLLDVTIVIVALPAIQTSLRASFSDVQWTVDAYSLSLASLMLPAGSLADLFGRRRLFATGLAIFTGGSLLCGVAQSSTMLIASRAGQGIGGAIMFATSLALLAQTFHGRDRGTAFGVWGAVTGVSVALGPVLGGLLTTGLSWRWIFLVNLPVGIAAIAITLRYVTESRPQQARRLDPAGFAVFTLGLLSLIYGLIRASNDGWTDELVIGCFILATVLLASFPAVERMVRQPMFDLSLFRKPTFVGGLVAAFGMNGSLFAMFLFLAIYLQDVLHYSALETGVRLLVITGATLIAAVPAGRLSARVPVRLLVGPGLLLVAAGLLLMRGVEPGSDWTHLIPGFIVAGLGSGLVNPPLASTAIGVVRSRFAGMASGINNTARQVGIATSVAALGSILANREAGTTGPAHVAAFISGLNELLLIAALIALVAGTVALLLIRQGDFVADALEPAVEPSDRGAGSRSGAPDGEAPSARRDLTTIGSNEKERHTAHTFDHVATDRTDTLLPDGTWSVDPQHSEIGFAVKLLWGLQTVRGVFGAYDGSLNVRAGDAAGQLTIEAPSLDTGNDKRDRHLRSSDFFDVERHPKIVFTATTATTRNDRLAWIAGELAVGASRVPLEIPLNIEQLADGALRLEGTTTVSCKAAGMTWNKLGVIGDDAMLCVRLTLTHATADAEDGSARAA
jgi:EmrB/QacA subfamily drug resistance transporter